MGLRDPERVYPGGDVVKYLVDAFPESLLMRDQCGNLPIHKGCENGANLDAIEYLIEKCPVSLEKVNVDDEIPLEVAMGWGNLSLVGVDLLMERTPAKLVDPKKLLQLHLWHTYDDSPLNPRARYSENHYLNLHIIQYMLEKFPFLARVKSPRGDLPLHNTCRKYGNFHNREVMMNILEAIIEVYPDGLFFPSEEEGRIPLDELKRNKDCTDDTVLTMVKGSMRETLGSMLDERLPMEIVARVFIFLV